MKGLNIGKGGIEQFSSILSTHLDSIRQEVFNALVEEAELIKTQSQALVPVDTGTLKESALTYVNNKPGLDTVGVGYGGATAPSNLKNKLQGGDYAIEVHENIYVKHYNGGQAKFLEIPIMQFSNQAINRLADKL